MPPQAPPRTWSPPRGHITSGPCPGRLSPLRPVCGPGTLGVATPGRPRARCSVPTTLRRRFGWVGRTCPMPRRPLRRDGGHASSSFRSASVMPLHTVIPPSVIPARPCRSRDSVPLPPSRCQEPLGRRLGSSLSRVLRLRTSRFQREACVLAVLLLCCIIFICLLDEAVGGASDHPDGEAGPYRRSDLPLHPPGRVYLAGIIRRTGGSYRPSLAGM